MSRIQEMRKVLLSLPVSSPENIIEAAYKHTLHVADLPGQSLMTLEVSFVNGLLLRGYVFGLDVKKRVFLMTNAEKNMASQEVLYGNLDQVVFVKVCEAINFLELLSFGNIITPLNFEIPSRLEMRKQTLDVANAFGQIFGKNLPVSVQNEQYPRLKDAAYGYMRLMLSLKKVAKSFAQDSELLAIFDSKVQEIVVENLNKKSYIDQQAVLHVCYYWDTMRPDEQQVFEDLVLVLKSS